MTTRALGPPLLLVVLCTALPLLSGDAFGDPVGICIFSEGGTIGTRCVDHLPIEMMEEEVHLTQDVEKGLSWNVRADYRFRNNSDVLQSLSMAFPAEEGSPCTPRASGLKVRIGGKLVVTGEEGGISPEPEWTRACKNDRHPQYFRSYCSLYGEPPLNPADVEFPCAGELSDDGGFCAIGAEMCFGGEFPRRSETSMNVSYSYLSIPDWSMGGSFVDPEDRLDWGRPPHQGHPAVSMTGLGIPASSPFDGYPQTHSVYFVLSTGATWQKTIGSVRMTFSMRDLPFNLRLCYGERCTSFRENDRCKLGNLRARIVDDGSRTKIVIEGEDVEPEGNIELSYARRFNDLFAILIARCGYPPPEGISRIVAPSPSARAEDLRLCRYLPHYYLGHRFSGEGIEEEIRDFLQQLEFYETSDFETGERDADGGPLFGSKATKVTLTDPRERYWLPLAVDPRPEKRLERGMWQLGRVKTFIDGLPSKRVASDRAD